MRRCISVLFAGVVAAGCVFPPPPVSPLGRPSMLHAHEYRVDGELVAVTADTVWMQAKLGAVAPFPTSHLIRLDVQRHPMGARRTIGYMAAAGAGTGLLLSIACGSVEGASCGPVLPVTTLLFMATGAIFGLANFESAWIKLQPNEILKAQPYSRYPHGIPDAPQRSPLIPR